ncbi:Anthranilate phosphoribosyltransferase [hydrothermal vent metagenome]|uniref:anthranilate phosphoribosyltransferase n=1 Tax=hydrothermal vent metagenome TaxID=652676 RepID=A0A3B0VDD8_9ZZZZ
MIKEAIAKLVQREDLGQDEMVAAMNDVMSGEASPVQIAAFITALRVKGETATEITGAARVMREKATLVKVKDPMVVDTCGTGGDNAQTFNISTAAAFVVASCGIKVAKHGNSSVSSRSGSADVLRSLGVNIKADLQTVEHCIEVAGIGFLFAPMLHGAMKYAASVRAELGVRTIFNMLGPLTNPARAKYQVVGVYDKNLTEVFAEVLGNLGAEHAFVVCGEDGLDEITLTAPTKISELKDGEVETYSIIPEELGLKRCAPEMLVGGSPEENARIITDIFEGKTGPHRDIVILNAAPALVAARKARTLEDGIMIAMGALNSGEPMRKLKMLIAMTNG